MSSCWQRARTLPRQPTFPSSIGLSDGYRTIAENHGGLRGCVASQGGGADCGGAGDSQRSRGYGAGSEGRHGAGPDLRGWKTAEGAGAASLFSAAQAERVRDHGQRSGRTLDSDGADEKMSGARVSGGAAGLCQRRLAVDDQRRGAGAEADEGGFARAEDVSGKNQRKARREGSQPFAGGNYD